MKKFLVLVVALLLSAITQAHELRPAWCLLAAPLFFWNPVRESEASPVPAGASTMD